MLKRLFIQNFAIIDEVEIDFSEGLNIITGETGAGKSIILGALGLLKGERANAQMVRNAEKKAIIEAHYLVKMNSVQTIFDKHDIQFTERVIIRRELSADGKTKAFVNSIPCNLNVLQDIGNHLVEIHSQHDSLEIKSSEYQLYIIDAFAENLELLMTMKEMFSRYKLVNKELALAKEGINRSEADKELKEYHLQELNLFDFSDWKLDKLEETLDLLENSLEIKQQLQNSISVLSLADQNLIDSLKEILVRMRKLDKYSIELGGINEELDGSIDQLSQISRDYERLMDKVDYDEERLISLREQFTFIQKMLKKHNLTKIEELQEYKLNLETMLSWAENLNEKIIELELKVHQCYNECIEVSKKLDEKRRAILPLLESKLISNLKELELGNSQFEIEIQEDKSLISETGCNKVNFLFTANIGSSLKELKNAISGGEMSRFVLAIKSMLAEKINLPTLIFDEIDTGVSGLVANRVANMLTKLSNSHQIIAITHLPQIASRGYHHFNVFKITTDNLTSTNIKLLHQADREIEIAKMISGENITQASLAGARELLAVKA